MTKRRRHFGSIRRLASGWYQARYRDLAGTMRSGPTTFSTKADASAFLSEVETELRRGTYTDPRRSAMTFAAWVAIYADTSRKAPSTLARDRRVIDRHLLPALGRVPLRDIRASDIQSVVNTMAMTLMPKTVSTNYGVLRAILNSAVNDDRLPRSPCRGIRLPEQRVQRRRVVTRDELDRIAARLPRQYRTLVYIAGVLGLRWEEAVALRVKHVDLLARPPRMSIDEKITEVEGKLIHGQTKTDASDRSFGIPGFIADLLAKHLTDRGLSGADTEALVFEAPGGGPLRASNFRNRFWRPAVEAADIGPFTFQGLRRSAMTMWAEIGMTPRAIQTRAGHSDPTLSQRVYMQYSDELDRASTAALDFAFQPDRRQHRAPRQTG